VIDSRWLTKGLRRGFRKQDWRKNGGERPTRTKYLQKKKQNLEGMTKKRRGGWALKGSGRGLKKGTEDWLCEAVRGTKYAPQKKKGSGTHLWGVTTCLNLLKSNSSRSALKHFQGAGKVSEGRKGASGRRREVQRHKVAPLRLR